MVANALIAYDNLLDYSHGLAGGAWLAQLPLSNLSSRKLSDVARSQNTTVAATQIHCNTQKLNNIRTVALVRHNLSLSALIRVTVVDANNVTVYQSEWLEAWPPVYNTENLGWSSENWWSGRYTEKERQGYNWTFVHSLPTSILGQTVYVEISDTNNVAGYIEVGRLFVGDAWQARVNMNYGASIGWETRTEVQETLSGAEYFNRKTPYRVARFNLDWLTDNEGWGNVFDLTRIAGIDREVVFQYDPEDTVHALRRQFLGRFRQLSPIEQAMYNVTKNGMEIKELI